MAQDFNLYKNSALDKLNSVAFDLQLVSFESERENALNDVIFDTVLEARFDVANDLYASANIRIAKAIAYLSSSKHSFENKQVWKEKLAMAQGIVINKLK